MLFHKPTKTAFVLPPKNGTTSLMTYLRKLDFRFVPNKEFQITNIGHPFPRDLVAIHPNLANYATYGFFRNPLDRYLSIVKMYKRLGKLIVPSDFEQQNQLSSGIPREIFARQIEWLDHPGLTVLNFDNYDVEVKAIGERHGRPDLPVPKMNVGKFEVEVTPEITAFVRDYYAVDYQFAKDVLNKEY